MQRAEPSSSSPLSPTRIAPTGRSSTRYPRRPSDRPIARVDAPPLPACLHCTSPSSMEEPRFGCRPGHLSTLRSGNAPARHVQNANAAGHRVCTGAEGIDKLILVLLCLVRRRRRR
ncbi:hypothetical protein PVAP13_9NG069861 [Panicum virgatum]|uniref:Uncharacterized protein n=1 Tax=Panicum virgatum TaxID=38727 RepID=A0A8T0ME82_PANVG|nr:hypothetical protein PVAP13_9NG069861 [Panicum virgatum]